MAATAGKPIGVFCVDDNRHVADALRLKLTRDGGFEWKGWAPDADNLLEMTQSTHPDVVILDLDMPGKDPFLAASELAQKESATRVIVFTGHVRKALIDSAVHSGIWGYVSKADGETALMDAIRKVVAGEFTLSPEVRATYDR